MAARCILQKWLTDIDIQGGLSLESCQAELPDAGKSARKIKVFDGEKVWELEYILRQKPGFYGTSWNRFATSANLQPKNILCLYAEETNGAQYRIEVIRR